MALEKVEFAASHLFLWANFNYCEMWSLDMIRTTISLFRLTANKTARFLLKQPHCLWYFHCEQFIMRYFQPFRFFSLLSGTKSTNKSKSEKVVSGWRICCARNVENRQCALQRNPTKSKHCWWRRREYQLNSNDKQYQRESKFLEISSVAGISFKSTVFISVERVESIATAR